MVWRQGREEGSIGLLAMLFTNLGTNKSDYLIWEKSDYLLPEGTQTLSFKPSVTGCHGIADIEVKDQLTLSPASIGRGEWQVASTA